MLRWATTQATSETATVTTSTTDYKDLRATNWIMNPYELLSLLFPSFQTLWLTYCCSTTACQQRNLSENLTAISLNCQNNKRYTARIQILSHDTEVIKPSFEILKPNGYCTYQQV